MTTFSPAVLALAAAARDPQVLRSLRDLCEGTEVDRTDRTRMLVALAGNPHLDAGMREALGRHRYAAVRRTMLKTGSVTAVEARAWYPGEARPTVAPLLVKCVIEPEGTLAAELGERCDEVSVDLAVLQAAHIVDLDVKIAAARRILTRRNARGLPWLVKSHLLAALKLTTTSLHAARELDGLLPEEARRLLTAPQPATPLEELPTRHTPQQLRSWLGTRRRTADEAVAVLHTERRLGALTAFVHAYPAGEDRVYETLIASADAAGQNPRTAARLGQVWLALLQASGVPETVRKQAAVRIASCNYSRLPAGDLVPWIVRAGHVDPGFASAFTQAVAANPAVTAMWLRAVCGAWSHLDEPAMSAIVDLARRWGRSPRLDWVEMFALCAEGTPTEDRLALATEIRDRYQSWHDQGAGFGSAQERLLVSFVGRIAEALEAGRDLVDVVPDELAAVLVSGVAPRAVLVDFVARNLGEQMPRTVDELEVFNVLTQASTGTLASLSAGASAACL